jgi:hypothetical protein
VILNRDPNVVFRARALAGHPLFGRHPLVHELVAGD